ncbi:MAG: hypothetical protein U9N61_06810 [Euryarchaeota archaeon]|nr:hypothetical protein [Euryarchaeota archaeon]
MSTKRIGSLYRSSNLANPNLSGVHRAIAGIDSDVASWKKRLTDKAKREEEIRRFNLQEDRAKNINDIAVAKEARDLAASKQKIAEDTALANILRGQARAGITLDTGPGSEYAKMLKSGGEVTRNEGTELRELYEGKLGAFDSTSDKMGVDGLKYMIKRQEDAKKAVQRRLDRQVDQARLDKQDERRDTVFEQGQQDRRDDKADIAAGKNIKTALLNIDRTKPIQSDKQYKTIVDSISAANKPIEKEITGLVDRYARLSEENDKIKLPKKDDKEYGKTYYDNLISSTTKAKGLSEVIIKKRLELYKKQKNKIIESANIKNKNSIKAEKNKNKKEMEAIQDRLSRYGTEYNITPEQSKERIDLTDEENLLADIKAVQDLNLSGDKELDTITALKERFNTKKSAAIAASTKAEKNAAELAKTISQTGLNDARANALKYNSSIKGKSYKNAAKVAAVYKLGTDGQDKVEELMEQYNVSATDIGDILNVVKNKGLLDTDLADKYISADTPYIGLLDGLEARLKELNEKEEAEEETRSSHGNRN